MTTKEFITLKSSRPILVFICCLFVASCGNSMQSKNTDGQMAKLCYVPFDVSTSAPMNEVNFSRSCADIGELDVGDKRISEILAIIERAEAGPFLDDGIRVGIALPDSTSLSIDDAGGVIFRGAKVKVDKANFSKIKKIITKIAREKGLPEAE